jgi:Spy/CpxP family protein refolding chaperone
MKTLHHLLILACVIISAPLRAADAAADNSPPAPAPKEMAALEHFLDLTDADLDQMQRVITRIRAMNPEARSALRRELENYRNLPDSQRHQLRLGWGAVEAETQDAWRRMMQAATPERRAQVQAHLQALTPENKAAYRRQLVEDYLAKEAKK